MANNGGRQGGGGGNGNQNMNEHVEFTVKAEEDLYLTGSEETILRVAAETNYSCLMLKTQRFSSLFRHYAKYHGLRKDDLEYYFVNPLENDDTPESVQLQRSDTIMVRKRRKPEPPEAAADDDEFFKDMLELLDDEEHMDTVLYVHADPIKKNKDVISKPSASHIQAGLDRKLPAKQTKVEVRAHKCILTARTEYFKAHFRTNASMEPDINVSFEKTTNNAIHVDPIFSEKTIRFALEFIYTNRIQSISSISTNNLLSLLHLSDMWLLRDLKRLVEHELIKSHMDVDTVARMYCITDDYNAKRLALACINYIMENIREVTGNVAFQQEMKNYPHLCFPVLKAAADLIPEQPMKKQRTNDHPGSGSGTGSTTPSALAVSSPVPDSDL